MNSIDGGVVAPTERAGTQRLSTADVPRRLRQEWLREVIGREYADVEITPPAGGVLFNEMLITPWNELQLSSIRSNAITLERPSREPRLNSQDAYFAVLLLSGVYRLQQDGREAQLRPGDLVLYDATRPHRIDCPQPFRKLIMSIPRRLLQARLAGVEQCTARTIHGRAGIGAVATGLLRSAVRHRETLQVQEFTSLAEPCLDLAVLAVQSVRPQRPGLQRARTAAVQRVKAFVERHLGDAALDAAGIATGVGLSARYINDVLGDEGQSLMRYVWQRRLERCRQEMLAPQQASVSISAIAYRWGFNELSHFSRAFRSRYGMAPLHYRRSR